MDMAPNSFDDQYRGCRPAMTVALPALNHSEFQDNPVFAQAWLKAVADEWQMKGVPCVPSVILSPGHRCHGLLNEVLYRPFNDAVREAGSSPQEYRDTSTSKRCIPADPGPDEAEGGSECAVSQRCSGGCVTSASWRGVARGSGLVISRRRR
ncbi:hypothetical protein DUI87_32717 [Hirundo rustica rustica]|uniref:NAD(P)(+)--arginine ADP-ribosyltransferase n=1 Tax=Hirundo rustica rustica TaxID=333673 RepID=A0A3M0IQ05_HIRRU|nr:hypothetical protein DUI87_32717 [Hirundo rustica rustica]